MSGFRRRATTIKCKELWQHSLLSITFPIGDTELYFYMVAVFPGKKKTIKISYHTLLNVWLERATN